MKLVYRLTGVRVQRLVVTPNIGHWLRVGDWHYEYYIDYSNRYLDSRRRIDPHSEMWWPLRFHEEP